MTLPSESGFDQRVQACVDAPNGRRLSGEGAAWANKWPPGVAETRESGIFVRRFRWCFASLLWRPEEGFE